MIFQVWEIIKEVSEAIFETGESTAEYSKTAGKPGKPWAGFGK